jgi:hypothetical protein
MVALSCIYPIYNYCTSARVNKTGNLTYKHHNEARSRNQCCRGKAINITYSECVSVALVIQHAKYLCRIILPSVACLALQYFFYPHYLIKFTIFEKKVTQQNVCFDFFYNLFLTHFSLSAEFSEVLS